ERGCGSLDDVGDTGASAAAVLAAEPAGDVDPDTWAECARVLRRAVSTHGGRTAAPHEGALVAAFDGAPRAASCATIMQRAVSCLAEEAEGRQLALRVGIAA